MKYTSVLFDLDGTLTRSEEGITKSALYAAEKLGFTGYTKEDFRPFIGPPLYQSFREFIGMSDEQAEKAVITYRERFSTIGWAENEVYEGIPSLFKSLKDNGIKIAIATAKPIRFAEKIAEKFGFKPYLDCLVGPGFDNRESSKAEIIAKASAMLGGNVVMVGDRCYDIEGGKSNSVDTIGVTYGYGTEEELIQAGATHIAHTVSELQEIILAGRKKSRGIFLTMEGVDGCGKTTQREALIKWLKQMGWKVTLTREPGGDCLAEKIRALLLDPENKEMCSETEAYLYAASRAQNVRQIIEPALDRGEAVVCDRFVDSSAAYQGGGRGLGIEKVLSLNSMAVDRLVPDVTVCLYMRAEDALERRLESSAPDRLEQENISFFNRISDAYEKLYSMPGTEHVVKVNAAQSIEAVSEEMLTKVKTRLDDLACRK